MSITPQTSLTKVHAVTPEPKVTFDDPELVDSSPVDSISNLDLTRTETQSTFTRHTNTIRKLVKEIMLGVITILQLYLTIKLSKSNEPST